MLNVLSPELRPCCCANFVNCHWGKKHLAAYVVLKQSLETMKLLLWKLKSPHSRIASGLHTKKIQREIKLKVLCKCSPSSVGCAYYRPPITPGFLLPGKSVHSPKTVFLPVFLLNIIVLSKLNPNFLGIFLRASWNCTCRYFARNVCCMYSELCRQWQWLISLEK